MRPSPSRLETAYRLVRRTLKPGVVAFMNSRPVEIVVSLLFRLGITRRLLNEIYERFGPGFISGRLDYVLSRGTGGAEFQWRCRMAGRDVALPVSASVAGSWTAAKAWGWEGTQPVRAFYECHLRHTRCGTFFDVGANYGIHSYPFAANGYRCVAFEPQPVCAGYMRQVVAINGFGDFTVEQCAVGEDAADLEFFVSDWTFYSSFNRSLVERFEPATLTRVNSVSLDAYCRSHRVTPTVMKIDVEGWEWQVLTGAAGVLERARPSIVIEVFPDAPHKAGVWSWFHRLGYVAYAARVRPSRPLQSIRSEAEFLNSRGSDFFFIADPEMARRCDAEIVGFA